jgi:hypothetical protein
MNVLYIVCVNYAGFLIPVVLVILFSKKIIAQTNLRLLRMGRHRLTFVIYVLPLYCVLVHAILMFGK